MKEASLGMSRLPLTDLEACYSLLKLTDAHSQYLQCSTMLRAQMIGTIKLVKESVEENTVHVDQVGKEAF